MLLNCNVFEHANMIIIRINLYFAASAATKRNFSRVKSFIATTDPLTFHLHKNKFAQLSISYEIEQHCAMYNASLEKDFQI